MDFGSLCKTSQVCSTLVTKPEERDARVPLKFDPSSLPDAKVGIPYEAEIRVTQNVTPVGDFIVDPATLPPRLELILAKDVHDTARITGTQKKTDTYTFRIDVWCCGTMVNGQMGSQEHTIVIE